MKSGIWRIAVLALLSAAGQLAFAEDTIRIKLENTYLSYINLGFLSKGSRQGTDIVEGELTLQPDGNWKGEGDASTNMVEEMKGLGTECPAKRFKSKQRLRLVARKVDGFSSNAQSISNQSGTPDAGYLALEVKPDRAPILDPTGDPEDPCFPDMYQSGEYGALPLLPLNDARWTQPPYGYIIGLPQSGVLEYDDLTIGNVFPPQEEANPSPIVADSKWKVRVERL